VRAGELQHGDVHLWTVNLDEGAGIGECAQVLSKEELLKAGRLVRTIDRERYIRGHAALRKLLSEYIGKKAEELKFDVNAFGKPRLGTAAQVEFNLSHSGSVAVIALCLAGRIGVDVEEMRPEVVSSDVAERFFSRGEVSRLRRLPLAEQVEAFFRCWTRKEAYLKAIGCGISDEDLLTIEVSLTESEEPRILRRVSRGDGADAWSIAEFRPREGFLGAVVAEAENMRVIAHDWRG
jgi:4'-phosphopantetheinyl transferase